MATDYTAEATCKIALTMKVDENPIDDVSANSNTAALKGAGEPDYDVAAPSGYADGSYLFDGVDDYAVAVNDATIQNVSPMTIVAWVYPNSEGEGGAGRILEKGASGKGWGFLMSDTGITNALTFYHNTNSTALKVQAANNSYSLSSWQHVAMTWDGSLTAVNTKIYVNGNEVSYQLRQNGAGTLDTDADTGLYIGNDSWGTHSQATFDGKITEVAIFNRVLSEAEIKEIMNYGLTGTVTANKAVIVSPIASSLSVESVTVSIGGNITVTVSPLTIDTLLNSTSPLIIKIAEPVSATLSCESISIVLGSVTISVEGISMSALANSINPLIIKISAPIETAFDYTTADKAISKDADVLNLLSSIQSADLSVTKIIETIEALLALQDVSLSYPSDVTVGMTAFIMAFELLSVRVSLPEKKYRYTAKVNSTRQFAHADMPVYTKKHRYKI